MKTKRIGYNITAESVTEGQTLYNTARSGYEAQVKAYADQRAATQQFRSLFAAAHKTLMGHIKIARKRLQDDPAALDVLDIDGARKRQFSEWLPQTRRFYENILNTPALLENLSKVGLIQERVQAMLAQVDEVEDAYNLQQSRIGSAQQATADRDKEVEKAVRWRDEVLAVADVAMAEKPDLRDKLGR